LQRAPPLPSFWSTMREREREREREAKEEENRGWDQRIFSH
jgi:hypothetical protein